MCSETRVIWGVPDEKDYARRHRWCRAHDHCETVSVPDLGETTQLPALAGVSLGPVTGNTSGLLGGGQVGCNYQFAPNWVIGIEGDGEAANIKGDVTESFSFTNPSTGTPETVTGTAHAQTDWIASVTGRLGWTWDRVMLYAKGGAAWAGDKLRLVFTGTHSWQ